MKLIPPSVHLIDEPNMFKRIEQAGRTCYKSNNKATEDSAYPFYQRMCKSGHESVLEHSNLIVRTHTPEMYISMIDMLTEYVENTGIPHYIRYTQFDPCDEEVYECEYPIGVCFSSEHILSGNYRAWRKIAHRFRSEEIIVSLFSGHPAFSDLFTQEDSVFDYNSIPKSMIEIVDENDIADSPYAERHTIKTVRIVANRGVVDEFARHRAFAHSVESTRYCNYNKKDVNEDGCLFVYPSWYPSIDDDGVLNVFIHNICNDSNVGYDAMMEKTKIPQVARGALNLWVKSEQVMTGTIEQWKEFMRLRDSSKAHPDAQQLAKMIREELNL